MSKIVPISKQYVLAVRVADVVFAATLKSISDYLDIPTKKGTPHFTVRGPYRREPPKSAIDSVATWLNTSPKIETSGFGFFQMENDVRFVFLRLSAPGIEKVWWKPDFPVEKFGLNPHITIFKGSEKSADKLIEYLKRNPISLQISDFRIVLKSISNADFQSSIFSDVDIEVGPVEFLAGRQDESAGTNDNEPSSIIKADIWKGSFDPIAL